MERITRSMVNKAFELLIQTMGERIATSYSDVGAYRLDYVACYGGYQIERIVNEAGGVGTPFGNRMTAREAFETFHFARKVLESKGGSI